MISSILGHIPPAFVLLMGAVLLLLVRGSVRNLLAVLIPIFTFFFIYELPTNASLSQTAPGSFYLQPRNGPLASYTRNLCHQYSEPHSDRELPRGRQ